MWDETCLLLFFYISTFSYAVFDLAWKEQTGSGDAKNVPIMRLIVVVGWLDSLLVGQLDHWVVESLVIRIIG